MFHALQRAIGQVPAARVDVVVVVPLNTPVIPVVRPQDRHPLADLAPEIHVIPSSLRVPTMPGTRSEGPAGPYLTASEPQVCCHVAGQATVHLVRRASMLLRHEQFPTEPTRSPRGAPTQGLVGFV